MRNGSAMPLRARVRCSCCARDLENGSIVNGVLTTIVIGSTVVSYDRDRLFTEEFREILESAGVKRIRTLPMAPHLNCVIESFVRTIESEALDRMDRAWGPVARGVRQQDWPKAGTLWVCSRAAFVAICLV